MDRDLLAVQRERLQVPYQQTGLNPADRLILGAGDFLCNGGPLCIVKCGAMHHI